MSRRGSKRRSDRAPSGPQRHSRVRTSGLLLLIGLRVRVGTTCWSYFGGGVGLTTTRSCAATPLASTSTKAGDGDPLDALAVHDLGVVDVSQKGKKGREENPRLIVMPSCTSGWVSSRRRPACLAPAQGD